MKTWQTLSLAALLAATATADDTAQKVAAAAVEVAFRFQMVDEEEPLNRLKGERCPNCGNYHASSLDTHIKAEKSWRVRGLLTVPGTVLCEDISVAPEYITSVTVTLGGETRAATVDKLFLDRNALALRLDKPFNAPGLPPAPGAGEPVTAVTLSPVDNVAPPLASLTPLAGRWRIAPDGRATLALPAAAVLLDAEKRVCGYAFGRDLGKGDPATPGAWRACTNPELAARMTATQQALEKSVFPATLHFRSPKVPRAGMGENRYHFRYSSRFNDNENAAQVETVAIQVTPKRLLISTAGKKINYERLERIAVTLPGSDKPVEARFVCTLKRLAAIVAELPQERPADFFDPAPAAKEDQLLIAAVVSSAGTGKLRIQTLPMRMPGLSRTSYDLLTVETTFRTRERECFIFSENARCQWWSGTLLPRVRALSSSRYGNDSGEYAMLAPDIARLFAEPDESELDPSAKPTPPEEEDASGWIGIELQSIGDKLAEAKGIVAETESGRYGGLVTQVRAGSPAAAAGVEPGWVLLSLTPKGENVPIRIEVSDDEGRYGGSFEWERLGEVPPQYLDHIPLPWPSALTPLASQLTALGIGTDVTAAFLADGKRIEKTLKIERGPLHYGNAPMVKWEGAGISLCDLTYEVREYLNLAPDAPGAVVCRIETGSSAVMAGIRPFEVITQINGQVIRSVNDIRPFLDALEEMRLNVTRMTTDRVVTFKPKTKAEVEADKLRSAAEQDDE